MGTRPTGIEPLQFAEFDELCFFATLLQERLNRPARLDRGAGEEIGRRVDVNDGVAVDRVFSLFIRAARNGNGNNGCGNPGHGL